VTVSIYDFRSRIYDERETIAKIVNPQSEIVNFMALFTLSTQTLIFAGKAVR